MPAAPDSAAALPAGRAEERPRERERIRVGIRGQGIDGDERADGDFAIGAEIDTRGGRLPVVLTVTVLALLSLRAVEEDELRDVDTGQIGREVRLRIRRVVEFSQCCPAGTEISDHP